MRKSKKSRLPLITLKAIQQSPELQASLNGSNIPNNSGYIAPFTHTEQTILANIKGATGMMIPYYHTAPTIPIF